MSQDIGLSETDYHPSVRPSDVFLGRCPFCFFESKNINFSKYNKGGKLSKEYRCPECRLTFFRLSMITKDLQVINYARWVVGYPAVEFFNRLKRGKGFEYWANRLKELGIASEFWEEYRRLKPKKEGEST